MDDPAAGDLLRLLFGEVALAEYLLVLAVAVAASIIGGLAGYGPGLLLPLVLVPTIGAEATVPVIGASAFLTNASRFWVFREHLDARAFLIVAVAAVPGCVLGAWGYSLLTGPRAGLLIGLFLIVMVPVRRWARRAELRLSERGMAMAGAGYGVLVGSTAGSGILLLSILMAAGLAGPAVIATDCAITLVTSVVKTGVFQAAGSMSPANWAMALMIGAATTPGAFIARWLVRRFSATVHIQILEAAILVGGGVLVAKGLLA
ncbi:TSUP family transporter [Stella sp.]|uniref:TSUP family transporter n=1 Tax=Stella sp. TaxID=2912054 RepID=UPI0035B156FF